MQSRIRRIKQKALFGVAALLAALGLAACAPVETSTSQSTTTPKQVTEEVVATETPQESDPYPLAQPGPYPVSKRSYMFEDASRANRRVYLTVWYPAVGGEEAVNSFFPVGNDLDPDLSAAPYPMMLSDTKAAVRLAPYLVSHGFTWVSVDRIDSYEEMGEEMIDQPLDLLFALGQASAGSFEGLEGMIDAEHTGVTGYSFGGNNTLALSGARIDPQFYLAQCETVDPADKVWLSAYSCNPAENWEEYSAHAGAAITASEDGLWQPMTDERIRAVMPMAGEGWWLYGERGFAAVDRPTLMIVGTRDELYPENALIFEHLGTAEKAFISFVGSSHMMIYDPDAVARLAHFAVAFFGYHLQGREELAWFFSEEFIAQHTDLAWGVVQGE